MKFLLPLAVVVCALPARAQNPVSVRVLDESGKPIAGALVVARALTPDDIEIAPQTAGADGKVTFLMPNDKAGKPTEGVFTVGAKGYSFGKVRGASGPAAEPVAIRLKRGQTWRGVITDDKGVPLAGARVSVSRAIQGRDFTTMISLGDEKLSALYSAQSGADGGFAISNLPANLDLSYVVTRPMFARAHGQNARVGVTETVKLSLGGAIQGHALDAAGKPLAKVKIYALSEDQMNGGGAMTDANGDFTMDSLSPGVYNLTIATPDDAVYVMPRLMGVRVAVGKTATAPVWRAQTGVEIRGIARDAFSKKPVAGASFAAQNKEDEKRNDDSAWATSDKNGAFVLRVLPGQYKVSSRGGAGYLRLEATQDVEAKNGAPAAVTFELRPALVIRGTTRDESGKPVAAKLLIGFGRNVTSDARGQWKYMPNGTDDITFGGGEDDDGYFEIVSPQRVDWPVKGPIAVTVRRHPWQKLEGRIVTPDGASIEGAKVEAKFVVQTGDGGGYRATVSATSDKDGRYVLEKLRDSRQRGVGGTEVEIAASRDGYQFQSGGQVTRAGREPRVSDLIFAPLSARIAGTTLPGARVVAAGRETMADDAGNFSFDALPAGENIVYAAKDNLFGSAPSTSKPLAIALAPLSLQPRDEELAREIWNQAAEAEDVAGIADLDDWRGGDDFMRQLRGAQRTGDADQIAFAIGNWKPGDTPESLAIARETLGEMEDSEARTQGYLRLAVGSGDVDSTARALEMAKAQFAQQTTDTMGREPQMYAAAVLIERRDGAQAGALALRAALAYTLQTHPESSRVEGALQTQIGRNEALARAAKTVAQGSPALLRELLETIDSGSGFAVRARAEAIPVIARDRGYEAAAPWLEELRALPEPTLDMKIRYQDFDPAWAYGRAVTKIIALVGPTDAGLALKLARTVSDAEQSPRALASAARYQPLDVAAVWLRAATEKIGSDNAPRVAAAGYARDEKLGLELFEIARQQAEDDLKNARTPRNAWVPFAFEYARANPAGARLILEREWIKSRQAKADDDELAAIAVAMAPIDARRANQMASELAAQGNIWAGDAQVKIARYLVADEQTRRGFALNFFGGPPAWEADGLQW